MICPKGIFACKVRTTCTLVEIKVSHMHIKIINARRLINQQHIIEQFVFVPCQSFCCIFLCMCMVVGGKQDSQGFPCREWGGTSLRYRSARSAIACAPALLWDLLFPMFSGMLLLQTLLKFWCCFIVLLYFVPRVFWHAKWARHARACRLCVCLFFQV